MNRATTQYAFLAAVLVAVAGGAALMLRGAEPADRGASAAQAGAPYVIVNMGPTEHDDLPVVTLRLEGDVVELFPRAVRAALGKEG